MIKVLEEKPVPRDTVICSNCGSLLEYGNADIHTDYEAENKCAMYYGNHFYCFTCPVCGCKVSANWIIKK